VNIYPKLKFEVNIELDIEMAFRFIDMNESGVNFGKRIVELYPELKKAKITNGNMRREIITGFIKKHYLDNKTKIEDSLEQMKKDWDTVEVIFFRSVNTIFGNMSWPKGDYICYLSIFDCNPRFLENKTFQVYFQHFQGTNHVIAHEMLHFAFFEYLKNHEPSLNERLDKHTIWLLSEWFNDLVLDLPEFERFEHKVKTGYPEVVEFSKRFGDLGKEGFTIQKFLKHVKTIVQGV